MNAERNRAASGKAIVLVAGGTGGLGAAVTEAFIGRGAHVIVTYRHRAEFDALARRLGGASQSCEGHTVDVTSESSADALIATVTARHGRVDTLVNAVGGYVGGTRLWDGDAAVIERMLDLNLRATYALARAVVPVMRAAKSGSFINIAARAGVEPTPGAAAYAASKAAAIALIASLAAELAGSGVRVNSILPSIIDTPANRSAMPDADFSRWPKPEDIARVITFLASEDARVVHGASIPVYGG